MQVVWDERKRLSNLDKHGFDFRAVSKGFLDRATVVPTQFGRYLAIGELDGRCVTVVFGVLGREAVSLVSMRPSNRKERAYGA